VTGTAQPIDRRRDRAGAAGAAAGKAQAAVTDIDNQLKTIAGLTEQQQQALRHALDEAARLKRSLKAAEKRKGELLKERRKAVAKAEAAQAKAQAAEAKYDKEILADLVRREKERNRAASADAPATSPDDSPAAQAASDRQPAGEAAPEAVSSSARNVAARVTAAAAHNTTTS
jgi:chromosome segregation ATPase